jgi:hypothetical protein
LKTNISSWKKKYASFPSIQFQSLWISFLHQNKWKHEMGLINFVIASLVEKTNRFTKN